jgi:phenylalanyl-tRNA synthetase alpha subunit
MQPEGQATDANLTRCQRTLTPKGEEVYAATRDSHLRNLQPFRDAVDLLLERLKSATVPEEVSPFQSELNSAHYAYEQRFTDFKNFLLRTKSEQSKLDLEHYQSMFLSRN